MPAVQPPLWWPAARAVDAAFALLARIRRGRAFHPRGTSFEGRITPVGGAHLLPFLTAQRPALVRLSKAAGLPSRIPDVYGLSFRVPDAYGPGQHQDLLLSTAGTAPVTRHLLAPALGFDRRGYSSLTPFRLNGRLALLGASFAGLPGETPIQLPSLPAALADGRLVFDLRVAAPTGPWRTFGRLTLERQLPARDSAGLRFDPFNTSEHLRPVGIVNRLRPPAYQASRRSATSE